MIRRAALLWQNVTSSFWFVPTLCTLAAAAAALGVVWLDQQFQPSAGWEWLVFGGGPDGARGVLSAIATSMVTVAGVVFSVTVVALTLASQQFTPRILRQFAADRGNHVVLGTFLATFTYCLLVLRTVQGDGYDMFVPHYGVTGGVFLAVVSLGMLIYFIHHITVSIQVGCVVAELVGETRAAIDRLFPRPLGHDEPSHLREADLPPTETARPLPALRDGYLRSVDTERMMRLCEEHDLLLRMECGVGGFAACGTPLARIWPADRVTEEVCKSLRDCFALDRSRTIDQDPEFGVIQIVDIAVKALSPGVNDPRTAITCVDFLRGILRQIGSREIPTRYRVDDAGQLRIVARGTDFEQMVALALQPIRHYGAGDVTVVLAMLDCLSAVAAGVSAPSRRAVLRQQVIWLQHSVEERIQHPMELAEARRKIQQLLTELPQQATRTGTTFRATKRSAVPPHSFLKPGV